MNNTSSRSGLPIEIFLPFMRDVARCEASLQELNLMWRLIESSAKMNCPDEAQTILPTMSATRAGFDRLEKELVRSLVGEKVATAMKAITTQATYVIDIVVRNLYERTADVGFLATDAELCAFVAGQQRDVAAARARLRAYRDKYTVYNEIMLIDLEGNVLVQIDPSAPVEGSADPLIAQTLASNGHVECFRETDLRPGLGKSLVYARRMHHPQTGAVSGLLCLFFGFEAEMAGIFRSHGDAEGRAILLLLDAGQRVIASADPHWVPLGATVPVNPEGRPEPMLYAGRRYLVRTCKAQGYQGYAGPQGWMGQVMLPLELAFEGGDASDGLAGLDPSMAAGLLSHARSLSPPLHEVITATETIRRVVWNGQVITAGQSSALHRLKTILDQISDTGARSSALFSASIRDLYQTVLAASLQQTGCVSRLLVDLLDRNLYERADDCRWWALAPELRQGLAQPTPGSADRMEAVLRSIHALYTVYSRLCVYDRDGRVLACSPASEAHQGPCIAPATLQQVLALKSQQHYHVPAFGADALSDGVPAYTYHAAIRHPQDDTQIVGGIAIVFDARRELLAMLHGGLGETRQGQAFFVDRSGCVISGTDPAHPVGSRLGIEPDLLAMERGQTTSRVVEHGGQYTSLGCSVSQGYREFKTSDGYRDDVLAVVLAPLGAVRAPLHQAQRSAPTASGPAQHEGIDFASFFVGEHLYAVRAQLVREAMPASTMTAAPRGGHPSRIGMLAPKAASTDANFVWVFDLGQVLGDGSRRDPGQHIVLLQHKGQSLGLLVDELDQVPAVAPERLMPSPFAGAAALVPELIKAGAGQGLMSVLDAERLFQLLLGTD